MASPSAEYDIVMMTDCRFPGGTAMSAVEEITAQTRAGYRTGLIHFPASVLTYPRPFNSKIRRCIEDGLVDLILDVSEVRTRLLLMRHPGIFTVIPERAPRIIADEKVLAVNQVPEDERGEDRHYDVAAIARNLESFLGEGVRWAPIGPRVRESLEPYRSVVPVTEDDWENIVDVAAWEVARTGFVSDRPVLGRHSRGHWTKWPADPEDIRAAWPDTNDYVVKVLGGTRAPEQLLGGLPPNWISYPFDSITPREFLSEIDFLVYYHHPGLIEAFGRVVLEGLAAGAVPVVDPYFRILFEDTCLYGTPRDVRGNIASVYGDWDGYADLSRRGVELVRRRYSYETHIDRVRALIGGPPEEGGRREPAERPTTVRRPSGPLVLFVDATPAASVTERVLVLAREAAGSTRTVFLAAAGGAAAIRAAGAAAELVPEPEDLGIDAAAWTAEVAARLRTVVDAHNPRTVVIAGPTLPPKLARLARERSDTRIVWIAPGTEPSRDKQVTALGLLVDGAALEGASADVARRTMVTIESATDTAMRQLAEELPWVTLDPQPAKDPPRPSAPAPRPPAPAPPSGPLGTLRHQVGERLPGLRWYVWRLRTYRKRLPRRLRRRRQELARAARQLRDRVENVFRRRKPDPPPAPPQPRLAVPPGLFVRARDVGQAPVTMLLLWDVRDDDVPALVSRVAHVQQITSEFRPLFVVTGAAAAVDGGTAFRRYGFLVEQVMPRREWAQLHGPDGWDDYAHRRLSELAATYHPSHTAMVDGSTDIGRLDLRRLTQLVRPITRGSQ